MGYHEVSEDRGALIVVEGLDRAGKTSQCQLLVEALKNHGREVKYVKFPGTKNIVCLNRD